MIFRNKGKWTSDRRPCKFASLHSFLILDEMLRQSSNFYIVLFHQQTVISWTLFVCRLVYLGKGEGDFLESPCIAFVIKKIKRKISRFFKNSTVFEINYCGTTCFSTLFERYIHKGRTGRFFRSGKPVEK